MEIPGYLNVMIWMNIRVCLPFTLLISLCCMFRLNHIPVLYYMNLLISNIIHLVSLIIMEAKMADHWRNVFLITHYFEVYNFGAMASLCFRIIIALERVFFFSWPQLLFVRQTKGFVMICVSAWLFCIIGVPTVIVFKQYFLLVIFALLSAPVFIICLVWSVIKLPAATSLLIAEKHRSMGIFAVLMLSYSVTVLPTVIYFIYTYFNPPEMMGIVFTLFLLSPFVDLLLFPFMCEGPADKLLLVLCCCRKKNTAGSESSRSSV